jgi:hypothetical protein
MVLSETWTGLLKFLATSKQYGCGYEIGLAGKDSELASRTFLRVIKILEYLVVVIPR